MSEKKLALTSLEIWNSYIPVWNPKSVSKLLFLASFPQGRLIKLSSCRRKQGRERRKKVHRASIIVNYVNWPLEWGQNAVFALHSGYNFRIVIAL